MAVEMIEIAGRRYRRFIHWPKPVRDGTVRCIACGQIDEQEHHDDQRCPATGARSEERRP